jgi:hypothetical protein
MIDDDDPFAPDADPYFADGTSPALPERGRHHGAIRFGRRGAMLAAAAACAALPLGCAAPRRLACVPSAAQRAEPTCEHRFCRYYRKS